MASEISDEENPLLLKKPKKDPLDFSDVPSSLPPGAGLTKEGGGFIGAITRFFSGLHPVVRVKDLNNPDGDNEGRSSRTAVEVGIGGTF